ncbi:MAG: beta-N-acetylglucosaminidase [Acidobacteria bacterium]|nr:MAG: beta-N-acetylglucosaminidase [Acidobacteriota bacterium]PIE90377.1 MAG: beta-N-acetylglucosaminidase [Acidobacteriota bacterium]
MLTKRSVFILFIAILLITLNLTARELPSWSQWTFKEMTLEEKVSQMFCAPLYGYFHNEANDQFVKTVDLVEHFQIGGFIFFQGTPYSQAHCINDLQLKANIPLLISQDLEWGAGMRVKRTTEFPSMMALGATRNPSYAYAMARVIAREVKSMGVHQAYAPIADINNNPRNPIINVRSFGETPEIVSTMCLAYVKGLQDGGVIATAKHFPGHGDTHLDSHKSLPTLPFTQQRLVQMELSPFQKLIDANMQSIMMGHLAVPCFEKEENLAATLSREIVTNLLQKKMGFNGLIVTDAMGMSGVSDYFGIREASIRAVEAGCDVLLMSRDPYLGRAAIVQAVHSGRLKEEDIDRSVQKILKLKEALGLHKNKLIDVNAIKKQVARPEHTVLSQEIARKAVTLLKNDDNLVPLYSTPESVLCVIVSDSDDPDTGSRFKQELKKRFRHSRFQRILLDQRSHAGEYEKALEKAASQELVIVASFLKVRAWSGSIAMSARQTDFIRKLTETGQPMCMVSFGNPYVLSEIPDIKCYLTTYSHCADSQIASVQALFGESAISGKLPVSISEECSFGEGLTTEKGRLRVGYPQEVNISADLEEKVERLIQKGIKDRAFPAASVAIGRSGVLVLNKGYGYLTYESDKSVTARTVFDLASVTKVISTTTAVMKLYEEGRIQLDQTVASYLPEFAVNGKEKVTIEQLLTHTSGLVPFIRFYEDQDTSREAIIAKICAQKLTYEPGTRVRYSDLGMITLALIVEKIIGTDIDSWMKEQFWQPLHMYSTGFRGVDAQSYNPDIAPTENDQIFRKRIMQGVVHDETAYLLGGRAGHAGLFSSSKDLAEMAFMLMNGGCSHGRQFLQPETIRFFSARRTFNGQSRGLGWDLKSLTGYTSCGKYASAETFGHTGFTGTSIWMDPIEDIFIILLTNRVYPSRNSEGHKAIRPLLANLVYESIEGPPVLDLERYGSQHSFQ